MSNIETERTHCTEWGNCLVYFAVAQPLLKFWALGIWPTLLPLSSGLLQTSQKSLIA